VTLEDAANQLLFKDSSVGHIAANTMLVVVLAFLLAAHYRRFAHTLANRQSLSRTIVFVSLTTLLMISVVKTSLALSLGLVGALSIIRFRTPVKDPEDLAYLFLAIAVGVGIGADQMVVTLVVYAAALLCLSFQSLASRKKAEGRMLLHVSIPIAAGRPSAELFEPLRNAVEGVASRVDLRRVDSSTSSYDVSFLLDIALQSDVNRLLDGLRKSWPDAIITLADQASLE
jgi:hypothetical protein